MNECVARRHSGRAAGPSGRALAVQPTSSRCRRYAVTVAATSASKSGSGKPKAVVVGGGFAGLGAALALSQAGADVVVLDANETPGGLSSTIKTPGGRIVEPGIKGFWYQYKNIYSLVNELGLKEENVFTPWTESGFYTPEGLQVRAPVLSMRTRLPAPLGNFLYTAPLFTNLPLADRLTAFPLITALLEYASDQAVYEAYDRISAYELFRSAGMSRRLYNEFIEPMLLVTLFAPGEELSAAAALDALYYFVLAHQQDFDVRWCRGPVGDTLLQPLVARLQEQGVALLGGRRVVGVARDADGGVTRVTTRAKDGAEEVWEGGAVVMAVGIRAAQGIVRGSPLLAECPALAAVCNLSTIDVMAVRLWLDRPLALPTASNVIAQVDRGVGATAFDLKKLQDQYRDDPAGSVIELDFYHASQLLPMSDEDVVQRCLNNYLAAIDPSAPSAKVLDACVSRYAGAVSAFTPGSHASMPHLTTPISGLFMAGDWVRQGPGSHGAKGLCQEKSYVTGLQAGNLAAESLGLRASVLVLPSEADEAHIAQAKQLAAQARSLTQLLPRLPGLPTPLKSPWLSGRSSSGSGSGSGARQW